MAAGPARNPSAHSGAEAILRSTKHIKGVTRTLLLYRLIQFVSLPAVVAYFSVRLLTRRHYSAHFRERLGDLPLEFGSHAAGAIWVHAVSVGEVISSIPLLRSLRQRVPQAPLFLSVSTTAGRQVAERQAATLVDGIFFLPFDYGVCVRRAFRRIRPVLLVVIETEIWPNLFATARFSGTALALLNSRISDRTWPRYGRWRWLFRGVLGLPQLVQVQSRTDAERYTALGASPDTLLVDANLKYAADLPTTPLDLPTFNAHPVWIAASTVGPNERGSLERHNVDEDDLVLRAFQQLAGDFRQLLLILAPRQPARFEAVAAKLRAAGVNFVRRSSGDGALSLPGVLLLDSMGELARVYSLADVVFVGGSLAPRGGHNVIEPAAAGVPIIVGPSTQNFQTIVEDFRRADAIVEIPTAADLVPAVRELFLGRDRAEQLAHNARALVATQRGVVDRSVDRLMPLYHLSSFRRPQSLPVQVLLEALSRLWLWGGVFKRRHSERAALNREPIPVPVISVGGLSMGGAGKTPFTIALADALGRRGWTPGILTRGYHRRSNGIVIAGKGEQLPIEQTGDEAQIFLRRQTASIGIGPDRYQVARRLLETYAQTDILLLDDGFQHARLPRDLDIVLIDGLVPFGNGQVFPAGQLREPIEALVRAQIAVVTRCEDSERFRALSERLLECNPKLAIFRAETQVLEAARHVDGPVGAFCGLGNPHSFWRSLQSLKIPTVFCKAFADHHRYRPAELEALWKEARQHGCNQLLTTEKDWVNLPPSWQDARVAYLPIETKIADEDGLIRILESTVQTRFESVRESRPL